jgi:iron complex transport system permease protein
MRNRLAGLIILIIIAFGVAALRLLIDRDPESGLSLAWPHPDFAAFRATALVIGAAVGASLAISGVLLQALLRNPLASPFILGISSGAGLGVMVAMYIGYATGSAAMAGGTNAAPALIGALAVLAIVYGLGRQRGLLDPLSLVLVGVVISAICAALMMFFQRLVPGGLRGDILTWMMGRVPQGIERFPLILVTLMTLAGLFIASSMGRAMDAATLGDEEARTIGLAIGPVRFALFGLAGALTAASVAVAGPIGFVGLIAPHAARLLVGPRHGVLVIGAALAGAALVVGADAASQALDFGAGRMPVGIFTALIGGPAFIWLLKHRNVAGV